MKSEWHNWWKCSFWTHAMLILLPFQILVCTSHETPQPNMEVCVMGRMDTAKIEHTCCHVYKYSILYAMQKLNIKFYLTGQAQLHWPLWVEMAEMPWSSLWLLHFHTFASCCSSVMTLISDCHCSSLLCRLYMGADIMATFNHKR